MYVHQMLALLDSELPHVPDDLAAFNAEHRTTAKSTEGEMHLYQNIGVDDPADFHADADYRTTTNLEYPDYPAWSSHPIRDGTVHGTMCFGQRYAYTTPSNLLFCINEQFEIVSQREIPHLLTGLEEFLMEELL